MRAFEEDMSFFMKAKLLNVKEDLLSTNTKVKRTMKLHVGVEPSLMNQGKFMWKLRLEGRIQNSGINDENTSTRFLELFEKVKIEFNTIDQPDTETPSSQAYLEVEWTKASSKAGSSFDCL
jgi:hypothetical protein